MNLKNHFLIAMPHLSDDIFGKSLIYICDHDEKGAMGIIVNKLIPSTSINEVLQETGLNQVYPKIELCLGGPVQLEHGFILHDNSYRTTGTYPISDNVLLTVNEKIIYDIISGNGPKQFRIALGYAGWEKGQLNREVENGDWLVMPAAPELIFSHDNDEKWARATERFGINMNDITGSIGLS